MLKRTALIILIALGLTPATRTAAQSFEPFTKTFNLPVSLFADQIIPMCSTSSANCIPDYKQVSHSVSELMTTASICGFTLDGSVDNKNFYVIAANSIGNSNSFGSNLLSAQANGYYPYLRIKVLACSSAVTIAYTGYSGAQALNYTGFPLVLTVTSYTANGFGFLTPTVLQGLTCTNSDTTNTAWLWVIANFYNRNPTFDFKLLFTSIAPGATYNYFGPPINPIGVSQNPVINYLFFQATTTAGGGTNVTNPVYCSVQMNGSGPYYPFFPYSP